MFSGTARGRIAVALLCAVQAAAAPPLLPFQGLAPEFSKLDIQRKTIDLAAFRGKLVLLNFWATWCEPCLAELPRFKLWQEKYGPRGLQVIGISMDDAEAPVSDIYRRQSLNYPVLMGDEKLGELYGGVLGVPVTFLIDRKGNIRLKQEGAIDLRAMERAILRLLPR